MALIDRTTAWVAHLDANPQRVIAAGHSARIVDSVLAAFIVVRVAWVGSVPTAQLAVLLLVFFALFRRPTRSLGLARWYPWLFGALLVYAALETRYVGIDPTRRATNLAILALMAAFLASGRIDAGSVIKGLWWGLIVNAALFYLHAAPNDYAGRLTGYLQDPNAAGLIISVTSILFTMTLQARWMRAAALVLGLVALLATGSRTSTAAYLCAVVWLLLTHRLRRGFQIALGVLVAGAFVWASNSIANNTGATFENRSGSDALRSRIDEASTQKLLAAPWHGFGLAQGTVKIEGATWFFNSSYQDLVVEGGFILAIGILLCYVLAGFGMRARASVIDVQSWDNRAIAAATLLVFFCGSRLGEVFLSPTGFLVVGFGLAHLAVVSQAGAEVRSSTESPAWYRFSMHASPNAPSVVRETRS